MKSNINANAVEHTEPTLSYEEIRKQMDEIKKAMERREGEREKLQQIPKDDYKTFYEEDENSEEEAEDKIPEKIGAIELLDEDDPIEIFDDIRKKLRFSKWSCYMEEGTEEEISIFLGITEASMEEIASISVDLKRLTKAPKNLNEEKAKMMYVDTFFHVFYKAATDEYKEKRCLKLSLVD